MQECRILCNLPGEVVWQLTETTVSKIVRLAIDDGTACICNDYEIQMEAFIRVLCKIILDKCCVISECKFIKVVPRSPVTDAGFEIGKFIMDVAKDYIHIVGDIDRFN